MSVHEYIKARNQALKSMTLGLIFLVFLPLGIPLSLIIIPFIAGRNGAKDLDSNCIYIHFDRRRRVVVGFSCDHHNSFINSFGASPKDKSSRNSDFSLLIVFTWGSFTIGVKSSNPLKLITTDLTKTNGKKKKKLNKKQKYKKLPEIKIIKANPTWENGHYF